MSSWQQFENRFLFVNPLRAKKLSDTRQCDRLDASETDHDTLRKPALTRQQSLTYSFDLNEEELPVVTTAALTHT